MRPPSRFVFIFATLLIITLPGSLSVPTVQAADPPQLWLPTPLDEPWKVIQGYGCGTHTGSMGIALDLASVNGPTYNEPVRAAADGTTFVWVPGSGTLILSHGNGYYTQYTHVINPIATHAGVHVKQGDVIALASDVATVGNPHLHFVFFRASGPYASHRQSLPLEFADGYSFPNVGGCNQHYGTVVTARGPDTTPPFIEFTSELDSDTWYCADERIEFTVGDDRLVKGFNQAFWEDPAGDAPEFLADTGYAELAWAGDGTHTFHVRAWDANGNQAATSFGPLNYDSTPPTFPQPEEIPVLAYTAETTFTVSWDPASDEHSGVEGYRLYLGHDVEGTSDWFSAENEVEIAPLLPGRYVLRAQAQDRGCSESEWITVQEMVVVDPDDEDVTVPTTVPTATPTATATPEPTQEPTATATATPTAEPTQEPTATATATATPTAEPTQEPTATATATATPTAEPASEEDNTGDGE
jgi:hypothetical protein